MCGIAGFIGASKKPKITYELITNIFDYLEVRGIDAAGVWGTEAGPKGKVLYHKEPIKSSEFIKKNFWTEKVKKSKLNLLLIHSRATSSGNGHARQNKNNHPFVSSDHRIGMIHNGTIKEADYLRDKYKILSNTDSEVLLRMYEHAAEGEELNLPDHIPQHVTERMKGIRDIWSTILNGAMAVAFGERVDDHTRMLCLFHNEKRPLWMADLRESLGQLFFFSSPDIWYRAIYDSSKALKDICLKDLKLHEVPVREAWFFVIDEKRPHFNDLSQMFPLKIKIKETSRPWKKDTEYHVKPPQVDLEVITELYEDESHIPLVISPNHKPATSSERWKQDWEDGQKDRYDEPFAYEFEGGGTEHEKICSDIVRAIEDVSTSATNACMEGSMSPSEYQELLQQLEQLQFDVEGLLRIVGN